MRAVRKSLGVCQHCGDNLPGNGKCVLCSVSSRVRGMDTTWMERAACAGQDTSKWFPESRDEEQEPRRICRSCPVKVDCLEFAVAIKEPYGLWGGTNGRQRQELWGSTSKWRVRA